MKKSKFTERKSARRLLITISFCFLMCLLPMCAHGAEYTDEDGTVWQYTILSPQAAYPGAVCINGCSAVPESGVLEIPSPIEGKAPELINSAAFMQNRNIREVVLPEGIRHIFGMAFSGCINLKKVNFPSTLEIIDQSAFNSCDFETLVLPENLSCTIVSGAFYGNTHLQTVTINGDVQFDPAAGNVFDCCTSLQSFFVNDSKANYKAVDGVLYSKDMTRLEAYPPARKGDSFIVPSNVETICSFAFSQSGLKSVTLPEGLTEIGDRAFLNSRSLIAIDIPSGVKKLGAYTLYGCAHLGSITMHEGLETIGEYALGGCSEVYELELPEGLTTIGTSALSSMTSLKKLYIPDSVTAIGDNVLVATRNVTVYTTNQAAAAYAQENGIACETATVEEYRAVETGQPQNQDPNPGTGSDPDPGNDPNPGDDPNPGNDPGAGNDHPDPPGPSGSDPTEHVKIMQSQSISCSAKFTKDIGKSFYLKAKAKTALKYKSSNRKVATVNTKGLVKITGYGTCKITITALKSGTYKAAKKTITINGRLAKPVLKGVNVKTKKVKLTWNKVNGATGYKLYIKYPGKKKYALALTKSARVKGVTHRNLTKKKTYCYKVRAYKKVGKKIVYSRYSNVIKVKIKK